MWWRRRITHFTTAPTRCSRPLGYDITSTLESGLAEKTRLHPACPCHERAGCRAGLVFRDQVHEVHQRHWVISR